MFLSSTILACALTMTPSYETSTHALAHSTRSAREMRPVAVSGELGWNGPSGAGLLVSWSPSPYLAFDGGLGVGLSGPRVGLQGRYNLLSSNLTPYLGLGVAQSFGSFGTIEVDHVDLDIPAQRLAQASVGLSYVHERGFTMLLGLGYAMGFGAGPYTVKRGVASRSQRDAFDRVFGSGVMATIALGYSFKA